MNKLIVSCAIILMSTSAFAEKIELRSGRVIEGEIIEKTAEGIRIDTGETVWNISYRTMSADAAEKIKNMEEISPVPEPNTRQPELDPAATIGTTERHEVVNPELSPQIEEHLRAAAQLGDQGNMQGALAECKKAAQLNPTQKETLILTGVVYCAIGDFKNAAEILNLTIQYYPNYAEAYYQLAFAMGGLGEYIPAVEYYQKSLELGFDAGGSRGGDIVGKNLRPFMESQERTITYRSLMSEKDVSVRIQGALIQTDPMYREMLRIIEGQEKVQHRKFSINEVHIEVIRDVPAITATHEHWVVITSQGPRDFFVRYQVEPEPMISAHYDETILDHDLGVPGAQAPITPEQFKKAEEHFAVGYEWHMKGDLNRALEEYEKALALSPFYMEALTNAGMVKMKTNDPVAANNYFNKIIQGFPNEMRAYYLSAYCEYKLGSIDVAREKYKKAIRLGYIPEAGGDEVGQMLRQGVAPLERIIDYRSRTIGRKVDVFMTGKLLGSDQLYRDAMAMVEMQESVNDRKEVFNKIDVNIIRIIRDNGKNIGHEKWTVHNSQGQKDYFVRYDFNPPADYGYKTAIEVFTDEASLNLDLGIPLPEGKKLLTMKLESDELFEVKTQNDLGMTISMPRGWFEIELPPSNVVNARAFQDDYGALVVLSLDSAKKFGSWYDKVLKANSPIKEKGNLRTKEFSMKWMIFEREGQRKTSNMIFMFTDTRGRVFSLMCTSNTKDFDYYRELFERIAKALK